MGHKSSPRMLLPDFFIPFVLVGRGLAVRPSKDHGDLAGGRIDLDAIDRRPAVADCAQRARDFTLVEAVHTAFGHGLVSYIIAYRQLSPADGNASRSASLLLRCTRT